MRSLAPILLAILAGAVRGDTLEFSSGLKMEGKVREAGGEYILETPRGQFTFSRTVVVRMTREASPLERYQERLARLPVAGVAERLDLARFCEKSGLEGEALDLYRDVLNLAPDHPVAREHLGYTKLGGEWMSRDQALSSLGLIRVGKGWATPDVARTHQRQSQELSTLRARLDGMERRSQQVASEISRIELQARTQELALTNRLHETNARMHRLDQEVRSRNTAGYNPFLSYGPAVVYRTFPSPTPPVTNFQVTPNPDAYRPVFR